MTPEFSILLISSLYAKKFVFEYNSISKLNLGSVTVFAETSYTGECIGVSKNGKAIYKTTSKDMAQGE